MIKMTCPTCEGDIEYIQVNNDVRMMKRHGDCKTTTVTGKYIFVPETGGADRIWEPIENPAQRRGRR
jgi:hypothetical protein